MRTTPATVAELPAFLRLCVLARTLSALVADLPPESLTALVRVGRADEALATVDMMTVTERQARALHAIALGHARTAPAEALTRWRQVVSLLPGFADTRESARLRAAVARGIGDLGQASVATEISTEAEAALADAAREQAALSVAEQRWLPIADGYADIAAVHLAAGRPDQARTFLHAAYEALRGADDELFPYSHFLVETIRAVVALAARAGDDAFLDGVEADLTEAGRHKDRPAGTGRRLPLFARYNRAGTVLAAFAIGAAEGGHAARARGALIRAVEIAGSRHLGTVDDMLDDAQGMDLSPGQDLILELTKRGKRSGDPLAAIRIKIDEASAIAWAAGLVGAMGDSPKAVPEAVAAVDAAIERLARKERGQRGQAQPDVEHRRDAVQRCVAYARCTTALRLHGDVEQAAERFGRALREASDLGADQDIAVAALLAQTTSTDGIDTDTDAAVVTYIADHLGVDWRTALDRALDGDLTAPEMIRDVAPTLAEIGDTAGLDMLADRIPSSRNRLLHALIAIQFARAGEKKAARHHYRHAVRRRERPPVPFGTVQVLAVAADAMRESGRPNAARRALRRTYRLSKHLATDPFATQEVRENHEVAALHLLIRPAVLLGDDETLSQLLTRLGALDPGTHVGALILGFAELPVFSPMPDGAGHQLTGAVRQVLVGAIRESADRTMSGWHDPASAPTAAARVLGSLILLSSWLGDLGDSAGVAHLEALLTEFPGPVPDGARAAALCATAIHRMIAEGSAAGAGEIITTIDALDDPVRRVWRLHDLLNACARLANQVEPDHLHRVLDLVEREEPHAGCVRALVRLAGRLPADTGVQPERLITTATRHAFRLRFAEPGLLIELARLLAADGDEEEACHVLSLGATTVAQQAHPEGDAEPEPMLSCLADAAGVIKALDPSGTQLTALWQHIRDLRPWREPAEPERQSVPYAAIADTTLEVLVTTLLYLPLRAFSVWLAVVVVSWLSGGNWGPWWVIGGIALSATISRQAHATVAKAKPASRWTAVALAPLLLLGYATGGVCAATGLAYHWLPGLFSGIEDIAFTVIVAVNLTLTAVVVGLTIRKWWRGTEFR